MVNLDDLVLILDPIILPIGETKVHNATSWYVYNNNRYDVPIYQSPKDTENLNYIEIDRTFIGDNTDIYVKIIVHYLDTDGTETEDPPIKISQNASQRGLTYSNNIVSPPVIYIGYDEANLGKLTIETSNFHMYRGMGSHEATSYRICELSGKVVYERLFDKENKESLGIYIRDIGYTLKKNKTYLVKARHHSDTNCESSWGMTSKTFGIEKIIEHTKE